VEDCCDAVDAVRVSRRLFNVFMRFVLSSWRNRSVNSRSQPGRRPEGGGTGFRRGISGAILLLLGDVV
jgi:hypothetical protein